MKKNALVKVQDGSSLFKGKLKRIKSEEFKVGFPLSAGEQNIKQIKLPVHCKDLIGVLNNFWLTCLFTVIYSYPLLDQTD